MHTTHASGLAKVLVTRPESGDASVANTHEEGNPTGQLNGFLTKTCSSPDPTVLECTQLWRICVRGAEPREAD